MCLVVLAWQAHPRYRLIVAANRDEFFQRPANSMHWWPDQPDTLAGRDLQAGGTWLATNRAGRFATVTNFREPRRPQHHKHSRGALVTNFVAGKQSPFAYSAALDANQYAGFSLLTADSESLCCVSNRANGVTRIEPGIYGLSNAQLDTPWPKLVKCREGLRDLVANDLVNPNALMRLLADTTTAPVKDLDDDLPFAMAQAVSAPFIHTPDYGTRCTTVMLVEHDGRTEVFERRFGADGRANGEQQFQFGPLTSA